MVNETVEIAFMVMQVLGFMIVLIQSKVVRNGIINEIKSAIREPFSNNGQANAIQPTPQSADEYVRPHPNHIYPVNTV